jgi:hypothetical protein
MHSSWRTPSSAGWLLLFAAVGIPLSLLWDFSWESTIGIDLVWSPPHAANYLAIALAGGIALAMAFITTRAEGDGVRVGRWRAPLGAWITLWGAGAFLVAVIFDRWWQACYGLAAGIWHPPQLLKAVAFFAVTAGVWLGCARQERRGGTAAFALAGGAVLALIFVVTLAASLANRQHAATFYQIACGSYPLVLVALAVAGKSRFSAATGALAGMLIAGAMVWLLPLFPASPQVPPIYHPRDHLLPPPFPPLLFVPALALDALLRVFPKRTARPWSQAIEAGVAFFVIFVAVQWPFAQFLLITGSLQAGESSGPFSSASCPERRRFSGPHRAPSSRSRAQLSPQRWRCSRRAWASGWVSG